MNPNQIAAIASSEVAPFTKQAIGEYDDQNVASTDSARDYKDATDLIVFSSKDYGAPSEVVPPLSADADKGDQEPVVLQQWVVRRLTPVECGRLQGFPDDFTRIPWRKKDEVDCPDGPRYKTLGNSMAVNVMRWIGQRINMIESLCKEEGL